jgi:hypothetical protein
LSTSWSDYRKKAETLTAAREAATANRTTNHSWAIYRLRGTAPAALVDLIEASDEKLAIERAIKEHNIRGEVQKRLIAQRRD